ncbi:hypothetical protein PAPYR_6769 [Paratrimastix pyriformis]|uniref:Uncharacterized protein n=1 Tax=Paratrimastix pyriformis TaxID=342808 RepID=A0ABQ8UHR4_9EUKA|nr:hypothetical protein PAPYR_6769 [Paratrimastix pyriformis]
MTKFSDAAASDPFDAPFIHFPDFFQRFLMNPATPTATTEHPKPTNRRSRRAKGMQESQEPSSTTVASAPMISSVAPEARKSSQKTSAMNLESPSVGDLDRVDVMPMSTLALMSPPKPRARASSKPEVPADVAREKPGPADPGAGDVG